MLSSERIWLWIKLGLGIAILFTLSQIVLNILFDPTHPRRLALEKELQSVPKLATKISESSSADIDNWGNKIIEKKDLWKPLVPPPPPPPPLPPPPPKKPNVEDILKGVKASRQQIGQKIKIFTPEEPRGILLGVGDSIKGCTIQSFDRNSVTFVYYWSEGKEEIPYTIPRE